MKTLFPKKDDISILDFPVDDGNEIIPTFSVKKGDEDVVFNITDYINWSIL